MSRNIRYHQTDVKIANPDVSSATRNDHHVRGVYVAKKSVHLWNWQETLLQVKNSLNKMHRQMIQIQKDFKP
ncbi:hypothetical protein N7533_003594 [Penicillium manginii]|uniref:uncharacterized protein n=1 Tax=Penicillium manginii TaxID=203109 RepID=UPI002549A523|nr:uncharacterized protein N7533_003594 [Penicillium manginii]KAJ5761555.1 hypothetical protein N7533_003594 [Penicillium manginii]